MSHATAGHSIVLNQEVHYHEPPAALAGDEPTDLNPQFDAVKAYIDGRQLQAAAAVLDRLEHEYAGRFTAYTWYRLFVFRGHVCRLRGQLNEAAAFYFRAKERRPDLENAQNMEVLGHLLLNDDKAFDLAAALREKYPSSALAASLYIQASPLSVPLEQLEEAAKLVPVESGEVMYGLAQAAHERGHYARAKSFAKRLVELDGKSIEAKTLWAASVVQQHQGHTRVEDNTLRAELTNVRAALTECINAMRAESPPQLVAHQYINLAAATRLLGEQDAADELVGEAKRLAPDDEDVRFQYSYVLRRQGKADAALAELGVAISEAPPRRQLVWAQITAQGSGRSNLAAARDLLAANTGRLSDQPAVLQESWYQTLVKLQIALDSLDEAERLLQSHEGKQLLTPLCRGTWLAEITRQRGDAPFAAQLAKDALASASPELHRGEMQDLATIFERLEDTPAALEALKHATDAQSTWSEIGRVIALAWKLRDEDFILHLGAQLRNAGRIHVEVLEAEVSVSLAAGPSRAEAFLKQLLSEIPDGREARYLRMRLTHLGIHLGRMDLCEADPSRLPHLDEVEPQTFAPTVQALRYTSEPLRAMEFAYALVRKFPNKLESHMAMIASMGLPDDEHRPEIPAVDAAAVGTAVLVKDPADGKEQWYVIEDASDPQPTLNEVQRESEITKAVLGQAAGAEVDVREAFGTSRRLIVQRVVHKYRYRFEDCFHNLARRFPDQEFFKQFHVKEDAPPQEAFGEILAMFRKTQNRESEAVEMYRQHPFPLHMLAHMAGTSELGAMSLLLHSPNSLVRCCRGNTEEAAQASDALRNAETIVLEGQTLLTWFLLHEAYEIALWDHAVQWRGKIIIGESTFDDIRQVQEDLASGKDRMGARQVGFEMLPAITSGEALKASGERLAELVTFIKRCTIVPGSTLNAIPAHRREILLKAFGRSALEAMILAHANDAILWTDDFAVAEIARELFNCRRVWTQLYCRELVPAEMTTRVTWAMLALRYEFTSLGVDEALRAGREAQWENNKFPLNQVLSYFNRSSPGPDGLVRIALRLLVEVWTQPLLGLQAQNLTFRLLSEIVKRDDGRQLIHAVNVRIDRVFGLNVVAAGHAKASIRDWLHLNNLL